MWYAMNSNSKVYEEVLFLKEKLRKRMFPRVVKHFLDSRLSVVLLTEVFHNLSWYCVGMCDSFQFRPKQKKSIWFGHSSDFSFDFHGVHSQIA